MTPVTGTCPACGRSSQPLVANVERYGHVAFHARCEAKMFADRFVEEIESAYRAAHTPFDLRHLHGQSWLDGGDEA
jgi:hypothetical protein